jgi:hypothetical protein
MTVKEYLETALEYYKETVSCIEAEVGQNDYGRGMIDAYQEVLDFVNGKFEVVDG